MTLLLRYYISEGRRRVFTCHYCSGTIYQKDGGGYSRVTTAQVLYIRRAEEGIHVTLLLRYYISEGRRRVFT